MVGDDQGGCVARRLTDDADAHFDEPKHAPVEEPWQELPALRGKPEDSRLKRGKGDEGNKERCREARRA
jgi:hypothetical protein